MSLFPRLRPTARGAALLAMAGMLGLGLPAAAMAGAPSPAAALAAASHDVLTLYSEPGLKGRHASYKAASFDLERQGFAARSAASTGMWTLCEGAEVASRCQTVNGPTPELKLSPQIARPGLNALALYDQPGLKGRQVIYSFAADRPAPFHARSARSWGGPWSLCDRGFQRCQTLDGRSQSLDLVVAAVRPEPGAEVPAGRDFLPAIHRTILPPPMPIAAHPKASRHTPPARQVRLTHPLPRHAEHQRLLTPVRQRPRFHRDEVSRPHQSWSIRFEPALRHPRRAHLIHEVVERHSRRGHAAHKRLYHRVRLSWGDGDPYLYEAAPRGWRPPPPW